MKHVALSLVAPIAAGRRETLEAALEALPEGDTSPLARVPGMHVGRFTIIDSFVDPRGPAAPVNGPYLYFAADLDGPLDAALTAIATHCGDIFRHCEECPEQRDGPAFDAWLQAHRVRDGFTIMPYGGHTLDEVLDGLDARERLGRFAVAARGMDAAMLRARFLEEFGGRPSGGPA